MESGEPRWEADTSAWPVALLHLVNPSADRLASFDRFVQIADELLDRRERYAVVFDLTGAEPNAERRRRSVEWARRRRPELERWLAGIAVVAPSPVLRGVATAVFWLQKPFIPVTLVATRAEAIVWAREQLADNRQDR